MKRDKLFKLIERNSGESIEESSRNGIIAHSVDVDGLIDDIQKALKADLADLPMHKVRSARELVVVSCMNCRYITRAMGDSPCCNCIDYNRHRMIK